MKKAHVLFRIIAFGSLTFALAYADEPSGQPEERFSHQQQETGDPSAGPARSSQVHGKTDQTAGKDLKPKVDSQHTKPKEEGQHIKPKEERRNSEKGKLAGPVKPKVKHPVEKEPRQLEPKKAVTVATDILAKSKVAKPREQMAKMQSVNNTPGLRPGTIRSRGATAALGGRGLITSSARYSEAVIGGAAMKRIP